MDQFTCATFRPQRLFLAACIVGNHLVGRVQNIGRGAIVLLQLDDRRIGIVLFKVEDVADIRTAPAVNGLVVITDDAQVAALIGEQLDHHVLGIVGVLILVHHDVTEALAVAVQHRRMIRQQFQRLDQQIIEVQGIVGLQAGLVLQEHVVDHLAAVVLLRLPEPLVRTHEFVLRIRDLAGQLAGGQELFVNIQPFEDLLQHGLLVVIVINHEGAGIAQLFDIPAEHPGAGGVEGGDPSVLRLIAHHGRDALLHFLGSLVGKSQRKDVPRRHAVIQQIGNTAGQRTGFAGASAGKNKHRALQGFSSQPLLGIEHTQVHINTSIIVILWRKRLPAHPARGDTRPHHKSAHGSPG